jgi:uncharacterized membrane protein
MDYVLWYLMSPVMFVFYVLSRTKSKIHKPTVISRQINNSTSEPALTPTLAGAYHGYGWGKRWMGLLTTLLMTILMTRHELSTAGWRISTYQHPSSNIPLFERCVRALASFMYSCMFI